MRQNFVKKGPEPPPREGLRDLLFRGFIAVAGALAVTNIALAYADARRTRDRAALLETDVTKARERNERLAARIRGLSADPAVLERWMREREHLLPGEEVVPAASARTPTGR